MKSNLAPAGLRSVFNSTVAELHSIEIAQADILSEVIPHIANPELVSTLQKHESETLLQIEKISAIIEKLGISKTGQKSKTIMAFYKEVEDGLENFEKGPVRDLKMAGTLRKVEHFEVGAYGTARIFAAHLDESEAHTILDSIWREELNADKSLEKFITDYSRASAEAE